MKLILTFLCFLSLYGCGQANSGADMARESRQIYRTGDSELQFILNSISDRLDKLENLRGIPEIPLIEGDTSINGDFSLTGTLSSTKACASGYVRLTANYCKRITIPDTETLLTQASGCTLLPAISGASGVTAVDYKIRWTPVAGVGTDERVALATIYSSSTGVCTTAREVVRFGINEFADLAAGLAIGRSDSRIIAKTNSTGQVDVQITGDISGHFADFIAVGYFD